MEQEPQNNVYVINFGRYAIDKKLEGGVQASSKADVLAAGVDNGQDPYVTIEQAYGKLHGRPGTFVLQHNGPQTKDSQA